MTNKMRKHFLITNEIKQLKLSLKNLSMNSLDTINRNDLLEDNLAK